MSDVRTTSEAIIAYRGWRTDGGGGLRSVATSPAPWPALKEASAVCTAGWGSSYQHSINAPSPGCTCGWYGFMHERDMQQAINSYGPLGVILGRVALWGRIVKHSKGYRAEYAYPQVLYYGSPSLEKQIVQRAAARYGIDAVPMPESFSAAVARMNRVLKRWRERAAKRKTAKMTAEIQASIAQGVAQGATQAVLQAAGFWWTGAPALPSAAYSNVGATPVAPPITPGLRASGIYVPDGILDSAINKGIEIVKLEKPYLASHVDWQAIVDDIERRTK